MSSVNNTTQSIIIQWQNLDLLLCVVPNIIAVSLLGCDTPSNLKVDDLSYLIGKTIDFQENACQLTRSTIVKVLAYKQKIKILNGSFFSRNEMF